MDLSCSSHLHLCASSLRLITNFETVFYLNCYVYRLSTTQAEALLSDARVRELMPGESVYCQCELAEWTPLLLTGEAELLAKSSFGGRLPHVVKREDPTVWDSTPVGLMAGALSANSSFYPNYLNANSSRIYLMLKCDVIFRN